MAHNYYLLNGNKGKGNTLNLLVDGKLRRDFTYIDDIVMGLMKLIESNPSKNYNIYKRE